MPGSLVKAFRLEVLDENAQWRTVFREDKNCQRLVYVPLAAEGRGLRLVTEETWGDPTVRVFAFELLAACHAKIPAAWKGETFAEVRAKISPKDLEPPESVVLPGAEH